MSPRLKANWKYGTPEWEEALKKLEAKYPQGFCWHCEGLLDYDGDWGAYVPTEEDIDNHFKNEARGCSNIVDDLVTVDWPGDSAEKD